MICLFTKINSSTNTCPKDERRNFNDVPSFPIPGFGLSGALRGCALGPGKAAGEGGGRAARGVEAWGSVSGPGGRVLDQGRGSPGVGDFCSQVLLG